MWSVLRKTDVLAVCLLAAGTVFAQDSARAPKFEIASVRPSPRSTNPDMQDVSGGLRRGGLYHLRRATMLDIVHLAYGMDSRKILGGPSWLELDRFDIRAKVPAGTTAAGVEPMLRTLLAERFGLVAHNDTKPVPAWALTASKHHLLKKSADPDGPSGCRGKRSVDSVDVSCRNMTMAAFASRMGDMDGAWYYLTDNLVVDETGLEGAWDVDLKYSQRWNRKVAGAEIVSLFDALEKIGLPLDSSAAAMPVVVIDSVNRTPSPDSSDADRAFPPPPAEFEVADVKPTDPNYRGDEGYDLQDGGRVDIRSLKLKSLIADAWGLQEEMIFNAPKFTESDRWDIVAKAPDVMAADGDADYDSLYTMLRAMLTDRFKLAVHFEERPVAAYTMTAPKPKLKKADPSERSGCKEGPAALTKIDPRSTNPVAGRLLTCTNVSMQYLAQQLQFRASAYVHSDVLDLTGLEGDWDFSLSFSKMAQLRGNVPIPGSATAPDPNGAISLQTAMEKQLGLKLELSKRPMQVLVIDHIEQRPTEN